MWELMKDKYPRCKEYVWPDRGTEAEKTSFRLQCDKFIEEYEEPSYEEICVIGKHVNSQYKRHILPNYLGSFDRLEWDRAIDNMKQYIKPDASPGVPFNQMGLRNDQVLKGMGKDFNDLVLDRIETRLRYGMEGIEKMTRKERIEKGICDPVRVFVKDEPHKSAKVKEGRVRLIMSVSLADKMIEMLLSRHLHKLEVANWREIPSKPGIGFTRDDNWSVYDEVINHGNMAYADVSGWDWSVKPWMMKVSAKAKIDLCDNPSATWIRLIECDPVIESESIYQFSDGTLVAPNFKGIVNSGKYKTSRDNSYMRVFLAELVGARKVIAAGDDTVESFVEHAVERYRKYGFVIKDYQRVEDGFEFCSRWYQHEGSYPLNAAKMLMNLLHFKCESAFERDMLLMQFVDNLQDHPDFPALQQYLCDVGFVND